VNSLNGFLCAGSLVLSFGMGGVAQAATYYTSKTGSDSNSCSQATSSSTPKLTVGSGVSCLKPGDVLSVRGGVYAESLVNNVPSGTSWSSAVQIRAYPNETVWLRPSSGSDIVVIFNQSQQYIEFDGINMDGSGTRYGVIKVEGWSGGNPHHIRFRNAEIIGSPASTIAILVAAVVPGIIGGNEFINLTVHGGGLYDSNHGIYIQSSNNLIENCLFYDLAGAGIQIYNGYGHSANNNTVRNNTVRNLRTGVRGDDGSAGRHAGMYIYSTDSGTAVYNNVIYNIPSNGGGTVGIEVSGSNIALYNNTVSDVNGYGILIISGSSNSVRNNIAYGNAPDFAAGSSVSVADNLFGTDPMFVNAGSGNFQLQTGSPAIDAGASLSLVTADKIGVARPQGGATDIGAYEWKGTSSPAPGAAPTAPTGLRVVQ